MSRLFPTPSATGLSMGQRIAAVALSAVLAFSPVARLLVPPLIVSAVTLSADEAEARRSGGSSGGRSSGGYSKPGSSSSRTPSFSLPSTSGSSGSSGGYSRPGSSSGSGSTGSSRTPALSQTDRDLARSGSGSALESFRSSRTPAVEAPARRPANDTFGSAGSSAGPFTVRPGGYGQTADRYRQAQSYGSSRSGTSLGSGPVQMSRPDGSRFNYTPPRYAMGGPSRFGMWDAVMLWFLLDSIGDAANLAFFHNQAADPGVQQWRAEAEKLAKENADLAAKLKDLDSGLKPLADTPRDVNYLPKTVAFDQVAAPEEDSGGSGWFWVLVIGGVVLVLYIRHRRKQAKAAAPAVVTSATGGSSSMPLGPLKSVFKTLQTKVSGETYRPDWFRVGMGVTLDPSPFLLLNRPGLLKTPPVRMDVEAVSILTGTSANIHRLYLGGASGAFLEIGLDGQGNPQDARYFAPLDEVHPQDADEWGFWLDEKDGMIGWPEFEIKDGTKFIRHRNPGNRRIMPIPFTEARERVQGAQQRQIQTMLYRCDTGLEAPAPQQMYLLVAASDTGSEAWVELHVGIDLDPATLALA